MIWVNMCDIQGELCGPCYDKGVPGLNCNLVTFLSVLPCLIIEFKLIYYLKWLR